MKKNFIYLILVMSLGAVFVGCDDDDKRANEIIAERERAQAFAKLQLELEQMKRDTAAREKTATDLQAAAKAAQIAADQAKAAAEASKNVGQAQDAATKAQQAAQNALLAANKAEELNNKLRMELARLKAEADSKTKYYPVPPNPNPNPNPYNPIIPGATVVGAFGGTVKSPGGSGAAIIIPPGSLKAGIPITINVVPPPPQISGVAPLCAVAFTPHGTTFSPPAKVVFPLPVARPSGSYVLLTYWNKVKQIYEYPIPKIWARVSFKNPKFAIAYISHFSTVVLCDSAEMPPPGWNDGMPQGAEDDVPAPDDFRDDRPHPVGPLPDDFQKPYPHDDNIPRPPHDGGFTPPHDGGRPVLPDGTYPGGPKPGKGDGAYLPDAPAVPNHSPKDFGNPHPPEEPLYLPEGRPAPEEPPYLPEGSPAPKEPPYLPKGVPAGEQGGR